MNLFHVENIFFSLLHRLIKFIVMGEGELKELRYYLKKKGLPILANPLI